MIKRRNMNSGEPMLLLIFYDTRVASVVDAGRVEEVVDWTDPTTLYDLIYPMWGLCV
jgi:hypothetical protein